METAVKRLHVVFEITIHNRFAKVLTHWRSFLIDY